MYWSFSFLGIDFGVFSSGSAGGSTFTTLGSTLVSSNNDILVGAYDVDSFGRESTLVVEYFTVVERTAVGSFFFGSLVLVELVIGLVFLAVLWAVPDFVELDFVALLLLTLALFLPPSSKPNGSKRIPKEVAMNLNKAPIKRSFCT